MGKEDRAIRWVGLAIAILVVFISGTSFGVWYANSRQDLNLSNFWRTYQLIQEKYVGEINKDKAAEGAVRGLVESLDDPFSTFLPASEKQNLEEELSGQFEGIGAELTKRNGLVVVVSPIDNSPAQRAGVKAKDQIVAVNDVSVEGLALNEVVKKIRGEKGSTVVLSIVRERVDEVMQISIVRDRIVIKSVESRMIEQVGYIKVNQFGDDTVGLFQKQLLEINEKSPKAVIIDLRNNPGGYLNSIVPIAGLFIPPNVVVKEQFRGGRTEKLRTAITPLMPTTPLFVLVNEGSASAAEILAGALQDHKRATLIGTKTFGKGSVQDVIDLPGGSALVITIAHWLTPSGRAINDVGIEPDVKVEEDDNPETDQVLNKALELSNE